MQQYNSLTPELIAELEKITPGRVVVEEKINPDYGRDEMPIYGQRIPSATIDVLSTEEVSGIMKLCYDNNIPVTTRGAGTGLVGGCVPILGGVVICTARMTNILRWDDDQFAVYTQPGVLLQDLKAAALQRGLMYPPDPGQKLGTIGGNVSTNAGGMRAIKYGTTKDYVRGMTVVMPNGEIMKLGKNVIKTSMGYNLTQLITGAEGTLGVITELTMKLIKAPKFEISVMAPFSTLAPALDAVPAIFKSFRPTALEFFEREILILSEEYVGKKVWPREVEGEPVQAYLLLIFDGDSMDEIEPHLERITDFLLEAGAMDVMIADTPNKIQDIWSVRSVFLDAIFESHKLYDENDVVVPIYKIREYVEFFVKEAEQYDFDVCYLGHAGDGNLHIFGVSNTMEEEEFKRQIDLWMWAMYDKAKELDGELTGEHGIGFGKIAFYEDYVGMPVIELQQAIKKTFDPKMILNPGKVVFRSEGVQLPGDNNRPNRGKVDER
ncbi:MAG: FAD-binding oxidoreductase [Oscillospiraceae bacterium]|nr:FAD-binding oxidoreductase [Oscillospiraceae bacterium]